MRRVASVAIRLRQSPRSLAVAVFAVGLLFGFGSSVGSLFHVFGADEALDGCYLIAIAQINELDALRAAASRPDACNVHTNGDAAFGQDDQLVVTLHDGCIHDGTGLRSH